jgi:hypothetical protein
MKLSLIINNSFMVVWLENAWQVKNAGMGSKIGGKGWERVVENKWWNVENMWWCLTTGGGAREQVVKVEKGWWCLKTSGGVSKTDGSAWERVVVLKDKWSGVAIVIVVVVCCKW